MIRQIPPIAYEEKDFNLIKDLKEELGSNWHDFFLDLVRFYRKHKMKGGE